MQLLVGIGYWQQLPHQLLKFKRRGNDMTIPSSTLVFVQLRKWYANYTVKLKFLGMLHSAIESPNLHHRISSPDLHINSSWSFIAAQLVTLWLALIGSHWFIVFAIAACAYLLSISKQVSSHFYGDFKTQGN